VPARQQFGEDDAEGKNVVGRSMQFFPVRYA
jgi:hypothetical protein